MGHFRRLLPKPELLSLYRRLLRNVKIFPSIKREAMYEDIVSGEKVSFVLRIGLGLQLNFRFIDWAQK